MAEWDVFGISAVEKALDAIVVQANEAAKHIVERGQAVVEAETKKQFTGAHKRGTKTTAAPGHPPDVVTGALRRSIQSDQPAITPLAVTGHVFPSVVYARIQELGGVAGRGAHLPARPYLRPAYEKSQPKLRAIGLEEWAHI